MAGDGFSVVLADLQAAADAFHQQSGVLSAMMPAGGGAAPDGGEPDINPAMQTTVQLLGEYHSQLAAAIGHHAAALQHAHDTFQQTEAGLSQLASLPSTGSI